MMLCVYPYCLSNFTRNEREAVLDYLSRARYLSREQRISLYFCRPPWWVHRLFIFAPDISREGNENFRARSKGASEFSLSLSSDFSFWFLNIIMYYSIYYSSLQKQQQLTPTKVLIPMLVTELSKTRYLSSSFQIQIYLFLPSVYLRYSPYIPFSKWGIHVGISTIGFGKNSNNFEFLLISVQWRRPSLEIIGERRKKKGCGEGGRERMT